MYIILIITHYLSIFVSITKALHYLGLELWYLELFRYFLIELRVHINHGDIYPSVRARLQVLSLIESRKFMCMHISEQKSIAKLLFLSSLLKYFLIQTFKLRYNLQVYKVLKIFHDNLWKSLEQDNLKLQFPAYTCGNDGDKITII